MPRLAPRSKDATSGSNDHVAGGHDGVLLGGAAGRAQVGRLPDPHPETEQRRLDALADGVDDPGAVLVRDLRRVDGGTRPGAATRLPVGRVDAGAVDPDPHLARPGIGHRPLDQRQDVGVTGHGVLDRTHALTLFPKSRCQQVSPARSWRCEAHGRSCLGVPGAPADW